MAPKAPTLKDVLHPIRKHSAPKTDGGNCEYNAKRMGDAWPHE